MYKRNLSVMRVVIDGLVIYAASKAYIKAYIAVYFDTSLY